MIEQNTIWIIILNLGAYPVLISEAGFEKIVYETDDWKINIKPSFKKELIALFSNSLPADQAVY